jgi:hypothetical protein
MSLRRWIPALLMLVAVIGVVAVGPRLGSALASSLRHLDVTAPTLAPTTAAAQQPNSAGPPEPVTSAPAVEVTTATATPTPTSPSSTTASAVSPPAPVTWIQTVPSVRDLIVRINGVNMATDGNGQISISPSEQEAMIEVVGRKDSPTLQQVAFTGWADGRTNPVRSLSEIPGPVAQVGVSVSSRVTVALDGIDAANARVDLGSVAEPISIFVGQPQWVVQTKAVANSGALFTQAITYTPTSITLRDSTVLTAAPQQLAATPEALWTIRPRTS